MTADAKIGLLLGLVFIFIIAFIINGLPHLWTHPQTVNGTVAKSNGPADGLASSAKDALKKSDWQSELVGSSGLPNAGGGTTQANGTLNPETPLVAKDNPDPGPASLLSIPAPESFDPGIRNPAAALKETSTPPKPLEVAADTTSFRDGGTIAPAPAVGTKEKPPAIVPLTKSDSKKTATTTSTATGTKQVTKEYVVQQGDTLGTIAKNMYGSVGNNVQRIAEHNRLKSEDSISIGQKLRIPPLPAGASGSTRLEDALPAGQFERVSGVGKPALLGIKSGTTPSPKPAVMISSSSQTDGRWYVVHENDTLWKIASSQLGNGARYEEIQKLNAAVLKSKDSLTIGMKLKLPAK
jgi:nucleoid-associated protein YgaU